MNNLTKQEWLLLERTHRFICKYIQGLPRLTRTDKCTSLLGWTSIESIIDMKKLLFLGRLCNMPPRYLPRNVLMSRLVLYCHKCTEDNFGFVPDVMNIIHKYDLVNYIDTLLSRSVFPNQRKWRSIVKKRLLDYEDYFLKERLNNDNDFAYFKHIHNSVEPHRAWTILRLFPCLKEQSKYVISLCSVIKPNGPDVDLLLCHKCGFFYDNPIIHILAQCSSVNTTRDLFWMELINIGPIDFSATLHQMNDTRLSLTLLSCNSKTFYELEQCDADVFTYLCVKFIHKLCMEYDS